MADEKKAEPQLVGRLRDMLGAYRVSQIIVVAAKLGVADHLAAGPRSVEELAAATGAKAPALYRVLRALASYEIFREREDGRFELTPLAQGLRSDVPGSVHGTAVCYGEAWWWDSWGRLYDTVMTGETAFDLLHKEPMFDYLQKHPTAEAAFNAHMDSVTALIARSVADTYDFSWARSVCDVGGGHGVMLRAVLEKHAHLRGILFEQPSVIASARKKLPESLLQRCELVAGSFFEEVPSGADAYLMKNIIHDWEDERALLILSNCRRAMSSSSRLVLVESVIPPGNAPSLGKLWDITMLATLKGVERTEEEYRSLLKSAQFELTRVIALPGEVHAVEAVPR
jgi:ubiquinone/menaquinone biosynthesis C-methylase UbiE